jgi:uncharacterized protein (TIGR03437 family)
MNGIETICLATPPARGGEVVVLYASGLGPTDPATIANQIPQRAAPHRPDHELQRVN